MTRPDVEGAVRATCDAVASGYGLEIIEVSFKSSRGRSVLSVVVDRPEGAVSMQDVTEVSEAISDALDREDPIEGSYVLEVSSAGIERPLTRPEHFVRYSGREIAVKCLDPIEGRRNFKGVLVSAGHET
ncbi:MAG: ribosome maturation factor RimP, partial [Actinomycetota bacterium]